MAVATPKPHYSRPYIIQAAVLWLRAGEASLAPLFFRESSAQRSSSRTSEAEDAERCCLLHHTQVKGQVLLLVGSEGFSIMDEA